MSDAPATAPPVGGHRPWWRRADAVVPLLVVVAGAAALISVSTEQVHFRTEVRPDTPGWDWDFFWALVPLMLRGLLVTARATIFGFVLAASLGLLLALARRSTRRLLSWPTAAFIEFVRSTPLLIQLFFLFFALPPLGITLSPLQALVIGLGVHYATYCSEAYRAGINSVPKGQWEASTALNLGTVTRWSRVIIPQAVPNVLPALGNFLVAAFKDAPLGFSIQVTGLMFFALTIQARIFRPVEPMTLIGIGFLLVSLPAAWLVRRLEKRLAYERV
jgi:polar amino acid transport system permease protein